MKLRFGESDSQFRLGLGLILVLFSIFVINFFSSSKAHSSDLYPWPTTRSWGAIASWAQPLIASGISLLPIGSATKGDLFILASTTGGASWYRREDSDWIPFLGGEGGGTMDHAALSKLAFAVSGHTGFSSSISFSEHLARNFDPHGATMTISQELKIGSDSFDTSISRPAMGTIAIASYVLIPPELATPTVPGIGTIWMDGNLSPPKLKCFDGSNWHDLW